MTANLFGERFLGNREPAWHGLGKVFEDPITAVEAVELCGLNYSVVKLPLAGLVQTPFGTQMVEVEDRIMIAREPTPDDDRYQFFGVASPNYGIIQNTDVAKALDVLTSEWPVETVGALGKGETIFFSLKVGGVEIGGEEVEEYFLVTDTKNGGTSMRIAYTPVRVVCQNTLVTGLSQAIISTTLEHHADIEGEFSFRVGLIDQMNKARLTVSQLFGTLAKVQLTVEDLSEIMAAAYPYPRKPAKVNLLEEDFNDKDITALGNLYLEAGEAVQQWEAICNKMNEFRTAATGLFSKINDEHPGVANTPWAAYNAVVELADYRRGKNDESIQASALFGIRAQEKVRAFKAALSVAGAKA